MFAQTAAQLDKYKVKECLPFLWIFQQTPKGTALDCVKLAIDVGYRHFDGALVYYNEHEVGQAIREKIADGTVRRDDIFYCGKVIGFVTCHVD